jgi:hypothetical protein
MQFGRERLFQGRRHSKPNAGTIAEIFRDSSISKMKSEARNHNGKVDGNGGLNEEENRVQILEKSNSRLLTNTSDAELTKR